MLALLLASSSTATRTNTFHPDPCHGHWITAAEFRVFSEHVWDLAHWKREGPRKATLAAQRHALLCAAGPGHRHAMRMRWRADKRAFHEHRKLMLWHAEVEPFWGCTVGGCGWWPIPAWSVNCESGGGTAASNLYGNLANYRGGSKWEQSVTAYELMLQNGGHNASTYKKVWLQWESGCDGYPGEGWSPDR